MSIAAGLHQILENTKRRTDIRAFSVSHGDDRNNRAISRILA